MSSSRSELRPFVRVVVVNWNSGELTARCLRALQRTVYPARRLELVVVDNGSHDGSAAALQAEFPDVRFVLNDTNLGFAEGCNRGMRDLDGVDHVALVNNDAEVEPDWLEPLVQLIESDPKVGAVAAQLLLSPGFVRVDLAGHGVSTALAAVLVDGEDVTRRCLHEGGHRVGDPHWPLDTTLHFDGPGVLWVPAAPEARRLALELGIVEVAGPNPTLSLACAGRDHAVARTDLQPGRTVRFELSPGDERTELVNGLGTELTEHCEGRDIGFGEVAAGFAAPAEVFGVCGGGTLLRAGMLRTVGLFDPRFFAYYEDTDLSWRMRRAGWTVRAAPTSRIHHAFGAAGGSAAPWFFFLNYRNWILTTLRNGTRPEIRAVLAEALDRTRRSIRANILSALKHRRRPSLRLTLAWLRVWLAVATELPPILLRRWFRGRVPVGARATERVRSRLLPLPR